MVIYRYSLIIEGDNFDVNNINLLLKNFSIHVYQKWSKFDTYNFGKLPHKYNYGGIVLIHDIIYATTEDERNKIISEYILFLEKNMSILKHAGTTKIILNSSIYLYTNKHFLLLKWQELKKITTYNEIEVRLDVFFLNKNKYKIIVNDMNKERISYENV